MPFARRWCITFVLLVLAGGAWAIATPLFASPDEPAHALRAWSVVHGEVLGHPVTDKNTPPLPLDGLVGVTKWGLAVDAPRAYADWGNVRCIAFNAGATADCLHVSNDARTTAALTYTRYFPLYYAVVGLPSLVTDPGAGQLYLMRMMNVVMCAALLALAFAVSPIRPLAAAGLAVAITPMVLFLAASINPTGLEVAAAIAVWSAGAALLSAQPESPRRVLDVLGISATVLVASRPLSPIWLLVAGGVFAFIGGQSAIRSLWTSVRARIWLGVITGVTLVNVAWCLWKSTYATKYYLGVPTLLSDTEFARQAVGKNFRLLREMIGLFGWLDTFVPSFTLVMWIAAIGAIIALCITLAPPRWTLAVVGLIGLTLALPIASDFMLRSRVGFQWQGRYTLAIATGIPVLAAFAVGFGEITSVKRRRLGWSLVVGLGVAQVLAFAQALRRYSVGADGKLWFFTDPRWTPPVPGLVLVLVFTAAIFALLALQLVDTLREPAPLAAPVP